MNNVFFKNGFLTSTEAQNICNVANEVIAGLTNSLNSVQFYNTSITSIVSSDTEISAGRGTTDVSWIQDAIIKIGQYNSLIAWLKEAIKNKKDALDELSDMRIQDWSEYEYYPTPKSPSRKATVEKDDIIENLDAAKLNKYFTLQSRAAAIGKFIHETGSISRAKVMLSKVLAEPNKVSGAGRDTVVYRYTPSVDAANVDNMFLSLMSEHRNLNAQLNGIKADAIEEANKQNVANEQEYQKARTAYSKEYNDWLDKTEDLQSRFNQYIITEKEKISKLKINVPDSLMETYKSIKALLTE
nr:MAG TPA: hypothetical protein [Bacteriophage sp.]